MIVAFFLFVMIPLVFFAGYRAGVAKNRGLVDTAARETKILRERVNARAFACGYRFDAQNRLVETGETSMRLSDV